MCQAPLAGSSSRRSPRRGAARGAVRRLAARSSRPRTDDSSLEASHSSDAPVGSERRCLIQQTTCQLGTAVLKARRVEDALRVPRTEAADQTRCRSRDSSSRSSTTVSSPSSTTLTRSAHTAADHRTDCGSSACTVLVRRWSSSSSTVARMFETRKVRIAIAPSASSGPASASQPRRLLTRRYGSMIRRRTPGFTRYRSRSAKCW
jgi:hypothetical protein